MAIKSALYGLVGASALVVFGAGTAAAGCGGIGNCDTGTSVFASAHTDRGPTTVYTGTPYDHMSSIRFQRAPHVEITRIHGQGPVAGLGDAPHGSAGGCFDHATGYCRENIAKPVSVEMFGAPQVPNYPLPIVQAPLMTAPVTAAPVMAAPVPTERVVAIGKGYDPSKFQPRIYGDLTVTPGIAHVPTSIVDRDPGRAQAVLDQVAPGSVTPALAGILPVRGGVHGPVMNPGLPVGMPSGPGVFPIMPAPQMAPVMPAPVMRAPVMPAPMMAPAFPAPVLAGGSIPTGFPGAAGKPVLQGDGTYASTVGADGTYWEKVSGATMFGDTMATSVICKRKLPTQTVNPVVGVPYPVPTPVPGPVVDACEGLPPHLQHYEAGRRLH